MLTILAFIVTIGVIVTIHEYGHFQVARWCGVKVLRFSIGFGKPIFQKTLGSDKTEFVLAAIPLGGYVKMLDENELKADIEAGNQKASGYSEAELTRAFNRQSVYKRIAIVLAGPAANLLLAILIYWILMMQGVTGLRPIIGQVDVNSIAAEAQLEAGSEILAINGKSVKSWSDVNWMLLNAAVDGKDVDVVTVLQDKKYTSFLNLAGLGENVEDDLLKKIGIEVFMPEMAPVIAQVMSGGAGEAAGLVSGDRVVRIDGIETSTWRSVVKILKNSPGRLLRLEVDRQGQSLQLDITPKSMEENGESIGKIGVAAQYDESKLAPFQIKQHYSVLESLRMAVDKTWTTATFSLKMMWYMITGQTSWKAISGPVTIASYAGQSADLGITPFLGFIALVSISIGVLNLLPIPVLDGGHLMYYMAEIIKGSAVSEQTMLLGQKIGLGLLGLLMMLAIFNDINRIIAG